MDYLQQQSADLVVRYCLVPRCTQGELFELLATRRLPSFLGNFAGVCGPALGTTVDLTKTGRKKDNNNTSRILSYMNPRTPVRRMLLYHPVGSGKTRKALLVAAQYGRAITVVTVHKNQNIHFNRELQHCTELRVVFPDFRCSIDYVTCSILDRAVKSGDRNTLNYYFKNRFVIMDEAHHARSKGEEYRNSNSIFRSISEVLQEYTDTPVLFLSATPVVDQADEVDGVYRLLTRQSPYSELQYDGVTTVMRTNNVAIAAGMAGYVSALGKLRRNPSYRYMQQLDVPIRVQHMHTPMIPGGIQALRHSEIRGNEAVYSYTKAVSRFATEAGTQAAQLADSVIDIVSKHPVYATASQDVQLKYLATYSIKYYALARHMLSTISKVKFVFDAWKERGGAIRLVEFLTSPYVGYTEVTSVAEARQPGQRRLLALHKFTNDTRTLQELLEIANSKENRGGELIEVIVATPKFAESISIINAQIEYIMEHPWNNLTLEQIVGRVNRRNSLDWMADPKDRVIDIYILELRHPDGSPTVEEHIRLAAEKKYEEVLPVTRQLAAVSVEQLPLADDGMCPLPLFPPNESKPNTYIRSCRGLISHRAVALDVSDFMSILNTSRDFTEAMEKVTKNYGGGRYVATVICAIEGTYVRKLKGETLTKLEQEMLDVCTKDTIIPINGVTYHMLYFVNLDTTEYQRLTQKSKCVLRRLSPDNMEWYDCTDAALVSYVHEWYEGKVVEFEAKIRKDWARIGYYLVKFAMPPCERLIEYKDKSSMAARSDANKQDKRKRPRGEKNMYYSKEVLQGIIVRYYGWQNLTQEQRIMVKFAKKENLYKVVHSIMHSLGMATALPI